MSLFQKGEITMKVSLKRDKRIAGNLVKSKGLAAAVFFANEMISTAILEAPPPESSGSLAWRLKINSLNEALSRVERMAIYIAERREVTPTIKVEVRFFTCASKQPFFQHFRCYSVREGVLQVIG